MTVFSRPNTAVGLRISSINDDRGLLMMISELEPHETSVKTEPTDERHV